MIKTYFNPGCTLSIYKPEMGLRLIKYLNENYGEVESHNICCRREPSIEKGSVIINVCPGCDLRFDGLYEGIETISIWEVIDKIDAIPYPDYQGVKMTVHDSCPVRNKPQIHNSIRSLLRKMNVEVIEADRHGTDSVCCGDDFYPTYSIDEVHKKIKAKADSMPCEDTVVYCVTCMKAMFLGGKTARYMLDLIFGESTPNKIYDIARWREQIQIFKESK